MKTRFFTIISSLVVLYPLISLIQYNMGNQVMMDGITVSGSIVWLLSILFSVFSWSLFAWASKDLKTFGIHLSIISGTVLVIPFHEV